MRSRSTLFAVLSLILLFVIWLGIPLYNGIEWMKISPAILLVICFIIGLFHPKIDTRFLAYALTVYLASFGLCAIGILTGSLFGQFFYGNNLGVMVFDTPLIIGIYWLLLNYSASALVSRFTEKISWFKSVIVKVILASLFVLFADILLEPVAANLDFWYWKNQQVPFQNYTAWFVFAVAFNFLFQQLEIDPDNKAASWFFVLWIIFLVLLNLLSACLFG